jgi:hypothetical protein
VMVVLMMNAGSSRNLDMKHMNCFLPSALDLKLRHHDGMMGNVIFRILVHNWMNSSHPILSSLISPISLGMSL